MSNEKPIVCGVFESPIQLLFNLKKSVFKNIFFEPDCKAFIIESSKGNPNLQVNGENIDKTCTQISDFLFSLYDCTSTSISQVCFKNELVQSLNSKEGQEFISALEKSYYHYKFGKDESALNKDPFLVWNWTLQYFQNDENKALHYLSVLFQNSQTNLTKHLNSSSPVGQESPTMRSLNNLENLFIKGKTFKVLPEGVEGSSKKAYHFYPIAYAARKLQKKFPSIKAAPMMAVLFNNRYEITKDGKFRVNQFQKNIENLNLQDTKDIYLGYQAYRMFINKRSPEPISTFTQKTTSNYTTYMHSMLDNSDN